MLLDLYNYYKCVNNPPFPLSTPQKTLSPMGKAEFCDSLTFKYWVENYNYFTHYKANLHDKEQQFLLLVPGVK